MQSVIKLIEPIIQLIKTNPEPHSWHELPKIIDKIIKENKIHEKINLHDVPCELGTYSRNSILYDEIQPWEIVITRWNTGDFSAIHGHPAFALYYPLIGQYEMDIYNLHHENLEFDKRLSLNPLDFVYNIGEIGIYNHYIHQVFANQPSITLHVYSEHASKGQKFINKG